MPVVAGGATGITVNNLIEATRRHLLGGQRELLDILNGTINASVTTLTVTDNAASIRNGQYLGVDTEVVYVRSIAGNNATVIRGMLDTTPTAHTTGAIIEIEPRFPRGVILQTIIDEIRSWGNDLYAVDVVETSAGASDDAIELDADDPYRILRVTRSPDSTLEGWVDVTQLVALDANAETDDFPSGYALNLLRPLGGSYDLRVVYARPFDLTSLALTTDIGDIGLTAHMADIPPLGAAWRLLSEAPRTDITGARRSGKADEVPPGHILRTRQDFYAMRSVRLSEERRRLLDEHGFGYQAA